MQQKRCSGPCGRDLPEGEFQKDASQPCGYKSRCKTCSNADRDARRERARWENLSEDDLMRELERGGETLLSFGSPLERTSGETLLRAGSIVAAAHELGLEPSQLRGHLSELKRKAARRGYSPAHDMTKTVPDGFHVKGASTFYRKNEDGQWEARGQWVKSKNDEQHKFEQLLDAMSHIADRWQGKAEPVTAPATTALDDDLLNVIPLGDPHIGLLTWAPETGMHHDLVIAERELYAAADRLISIAPPARRALVASLGDFFHADNRGNTTTGGTPVDSDGRWPKVLRVGIRLMRRVIDRALERFEFVDVVCSIGNHDWHSSIMLATCLAQFYEREPRVRVDTSPAKFHWHRFGQNLLGFTHGDTVKLFELPGIMAVDRAQDWGETRHRWFGVGHVHHDQVKELPGCVVETIRTLAPADAWHRGQGYRSGQDLKLLVFHREWGQIMRHVVGIDYVRAMTSVAASAS